MNTSRIPTDPHWEALMADHRLMELCELQRIGDEPLDLFALQEIQHSNILAWMFNAREGHGQGDEILRDLLLAGAGAAADACPLAKSSATYQFFQQWPASRIRTTGFGAAFCVRELVLKAADRADLFVIDPHNKFILLLENKKNDAWLKKAQLEGYKSAYEELVRRNPRLKQFAVAFLTLSRVVEEGQADRPCQDTWLHLGYSWLKRSATRALLQVRKGNSSAQLVLSYCNRQTDWENPDDARSLELAASLHADYPAALKVLTATREKDFVSEWLHAPEAPTVQALFAMQNRGALDLLRATRGMASLKTALVAAAPYLQNNILHTGKFLRVCPLGCENYRNADGEWLLFLSVVYSDREQPPYNLRLSWAGSPDKNADGEQTLFEKLEKFRPEFQKWKGAARRVVPLAKNLQQAALVKELTKEIGAMQRALFPDRTPQGPSTRRAQR